MWLFNIFKNKSKVKKIPSRTLDELKNITKILFVDDKAFKVIDNIKEVAQYHYLLKFVSFYSYINCYTN